MCPYRLIRALSFVDYLQQRRSTKTVCFQSIGLPRIHPLLTPAGSRVPAQRRSHVAGGPVSTGHQDHCRFPQGQRCGLPGELSHIRAVLPVGGAAQRTHAGYSNGEQFPTCDDAVTTAYVSGNGGINCQGDDTPLSARDVFAYDAANDQYQYPVGKWLRLKQVNGLHRIYAVRGACAAWAMKPRCSRQSDGT